LIAVIREFGESNFDRSSIRQWRFEGGLPDAVVEAFVGISFSDVTGITELTDICDSIFDQVLVTEEISRCAGATLPFPMDMFDLWLVRKYGNEKQKDSISSDYRENGRLKFSFAASEPNAGTASVNMTTNTRIKDGVIVLNGQKTFIQNGEFSPYILLSAIDGDVSGEGDPNLNLWLVPRTLEGVSTFPIPKIGQEILPFADVVFHDVILDPSAQVAKGAWDFTQLFHVFDLERIIVSAMSLGLAQAAMEDAARYAGKREVLGRRIGDYQQVGMMLADMEVKLTNMRRMVYAAAVNADRGREDRLGIALMKRFVPKAATEIASDALQIFGGLGYTQQERVGEIWKDCRGNQINGGTDEVMATIAGALVIKKYENEQL
jgi:alkylation response protein AidB-like acyl-CoA dehydrogenase